MSRRFISWSLLLLLLLDSPAGLSELQSCFSQQLPASPTGPPKADQEIVRINTNLVQVDVVVTKDGKPVTDLKPEDFEIFQDERAQKITNLSYISNLPPADATTIAKESPPAKNEIPVVPSKVNLRDNKRIIALVYDDLGLTFESAAEVKIALRKFVLEQFQPNDLVAIIRTGGEVGALQQFTNDKRLLLSAVDHLHWNPCSRAGVLRSKPLRAVDYSNDLNPCAVNSYLNAIKALRFILRGIGNLPGRKAMLIFSDRMPVEDQEMQPADFGFNRVGNQKPLEPWKQPVSFDDQLRRLAELAIRSSVVIYGIDAQGLQTTGLTAADEIVFPPLGTRTRPDQDPVAKLVLGRSEALRRNREGADMLARQTGGFLTRNSSSAGFQNILDDQSGYYLIGYRPDTETFDRRFHRITARVKRRGLTVRTRAGFYGITQDEVRAAEESNTDPMTRAILSPFGTNDITVRLHTFFASDPIQGSLLRVNLFIDPSNITFTDEPGGAHKAMFDLHNVLFGDNGKIVYQKEQTATLRLKGQPYERVVREGIAYSFDLQVKESGSYQFRVAVRDTTSSRIGTAGQFVEIPNLENGRLMLSGIALLRDTNSAVRTDTQAAARQFRAGSTLVFVYAVYNATLDRVTRQPRLSTQTRIFHDGKEIYTAGATPLDVKDQPDLRRISGGAQLQLGPELMPGEYVLQVSVVDQLSQKQAKSVQWVDFEVIK